MVDKLGFIFISAEHSKEDKNTVLKGNIHDEYANKLLDVWY